MTSAFKANFKNGLYRISGTSFIIGTSGKKSNLTDYSLDDISI
jgi:hypothetical protein